MKGDAHTSVILELRDGQAVVIDNQKVTVRVPGMYLLMTSFSGTTGRVRNNLTYLGAARKPDGDG